MRINLRIDGVAGGHSHCSLFVNGSKAGNIVLRNEEVDGLKLRMSQMYCTDLILQITEGQKVYEVVFSDSPG